MIIRVLFFFWLALAGVATALEIQVDLLDSPDRSRFSARGEVVLELYQPTAEQVAHTKKLLSQPGPVKVTIEGSDAVLWLADQKLADIKPDQASRWNTTPYSLAQTFASRLRQAHQGPPPLSLSPDGLVVPVDENRTARIQGAPTEKPVLTNDSPHTAEVEFDGQQVQVRGLQPGQGTVTLDWGERRLELPYKVRYWAGRIPQRIDLSLTGPATHETVRQAVLRELLDSVHPTASVELTLPGKFQEGGQTITIRARGWELLPVEREVGLTLSRSSLALEPAQALALSNRPEKIGSPGWLFDRLLPAGPTRLLFHHRNNPGEVLRYVEVVVDNQDSRTARLHSVIASFGPSEDEIHVGHIATLRFVERLLQRQGQVLRIEPGQSRVIDRLKMKPGWTISGMAHLTPLDGAKLRLRVRVVSPSEPFRDEYVVTPPNTRTARGLFAADLEKAYSHILGSRYTYIDLGGEPFLEDPETGESSPGNFGTVYRVQLVLHNPAEIPREAWLEFVPGGGPARGVVLVDRQLMDVAMGNSRTRIPLSRWTLEPGETREVVIETLPQSGSNYPVRLVVQSEYEAREETTLEPQQVPSVLIP